MLNQSLFEMSFVENALVFLFANGSVLDHNFEYKNAVKVEQLAQDIVELGKQYYGSDFDGYTVAKINDGALEELEEEFLFNNFRKQHLN